ncbi:hypothetical protein [Shimia abyssi]|uniref:hypothetical protein n=1 Tax=Shimia abyssi TaxID=1662395 RepID=UPI001A9F8AE4|nr:hypothetical protein [Shimia abyssi]
MPGQPGPFSLGGPGVLAELLERTGFTEVKETVIHPPLRLPLAADCLRFERESFGALHQMLSGLTAKDQNTVWEEVAVALTKYEAADGFEGPCELVVTSGRN